MVFPKKLKKGDTIAIVATSSPTSFEKAMSAKAVIEEQGYNAILCENTYENLNGYIAGSADKRASILNDMFADPHVDGIFCMRGGYMSNYLLDKLNLDVIRANPKVFVGYSDVTSLHTFLNQEAGLVTYHGPMVGANMVDHYDDFTKEQFTRALNMDDAFALLNPEQKPFHVIAEGEARGIITGGNLCVLASNMGTPHEISTEGKIIFLEEVHEIVPRVHRLLAQLELGGHFKAAAGIMLGSFTDWQTPDYPNYSMTDFFHDFFRDFNIPIMANIQCGHDHPMSTIPLGAMCNMNTKEKSIVFSRG